MHTDGGYRLSIVLLLVVLVGAAIRSFANGLYRAREDPAATAEITSRASDAAFGVAVWFFTWMALGSTVPENKSLDLLPVTVIVGFLLGSVLESCIASSFKHLGTAIGMYLKKE